MADPTRAVSTRNQVLTAGDYLSAYVFEWTLHHLDLIAHLPDAPPPSAGGLAQSRETLEELAGTTMPPAFADADALLIGTGRRAATPGERLEMGEAAQRFPIYVG